VSRKVGSLSLRPCVCERDRADGMRVCVYVTIAGEKGEKKTEGREVALVNAYLLSLRLCVRER